jgi:hypothetical protein
MTLSLGKPKVIPSHFYHIGIPCHSASWSDYEQLRDDPNHRKNLALI